MGYCDKTLIMEGPSGPEKTTLLAELAGWLATRGLRPAVARFWPEPDWGDAGKDTWKFRQAGADPVALAAPGLWQITTVLKGNAAAARKQVLAALAPYADLILVDEPGPVHPPPDPAGRPGALAWIGPGLPSGSLPVFPSHQIPELGRYLLKRLKLAHAGDEAPGKRPPD